MKPLFFVLLLLIYSSASFSQQTTADYLQKSKHQKTAAWILLGGGGTLMLTGIIIPHGDVVHEGFWTNYENDNIKAIMVLGGFLSMLSSTPLFIIAAKNKRKGMNISFKNQPVPQLQNKGFVYRTIPSLNFKISL